MMSICLNLMFIFVLCNVFPTPLEGSVVSREYLQGCHKDVVFIIADENTEIVEATLRL